MPLMQIRRMLLASVLVCIVFATSACTPEAPKPAPTPTKTAVFASEEDALQAAIDVYQKYSAAYDRITATGVADYGPVEDLVTSDFLAELQADTSFEDQGLHTTGSSTFDNASLVSLEQDAEKATVRVRLCRDVTNLKIVNADGEDASADKRDYRFPYEVMFFQRADDTRLRVADTGSWSGDDFC